MSRRPRRLPLLPLVALGLILMAGLSVWIFSKSIIAPVSNEEKSQEFVVEKGASTLSIAKDLYAAGLIRSPLGFRYAVRLEGLGGKLQAGVYRLSGHLSAREIASSLTRGYNDQLVTIPEGYRLEEIAATYETKLGIPASEFLQAAKGQEGWLFPDTYAVSPSTTATQLVEQMSQNFTNKVGEIDDRTLILASLIERETRGDAEKPLVAGILEKRLEADWPLELDATVQYVLGKKGEWWPVTTLKDRQTASPYNTYLNRGLPPGPICNPGLKSIEAARSPQVTAYWFYLHGRDGEIRYAETLEGHNANIEKYLR